VNFSGTPCRVRFDAAAAPSAEVYMIVSQDEMPLAVLAKAVAKNGG
jgi:hypothetical protein